MPLIRNEQEVKRESQFLDYESGDGGNMLILKSHLYQIKSHFIKSVNRSVACRETECLYCAANYKKATEFNYKVFLNGQEGYINIKPSVFYAIQGIARAQKKDPRQISWTVIKKGEGLATEYTTSKDDNLTKEDYDKVLAELDDNTQKLVAVMERHEEDLNSNYALYLKEIKEQKAPVVTTTINSRVEMPREKVQIAEDVPGTEGERAEPSEIPF